MANYGTNSELTQEDLSEARKRLLEPLVDGWSREVVFRPVSDTRKKRRADIYYFSPEGLKFRSRKEIGRYLKDQGITRYSCTDHFSFSNEVLGQEFEPYEMIRESHSKGSKIRRRVSSEASIVSAPAPLPIVKESDSHDEEGMVFDEEIEIDYGEGHIAIFDPAVLLCRAEYAMACDQRRE